MEKLVKAIREFPLWLFLMIIASIVLVFSIFEFQISGGTFSSKPIAPVFYEGLFVSGVIFALAFATIIASSLSGSALISGMVIGRRKNSVMLGKINVEILFGEIQSVASAELTVLPANEFFDDECICDVRSSLGAYFQSKVPGRTEAIRAAATAHLQDNAVDSAQSVLNHKGEGRLAYEIGTVVPVKGVDGLTERVALVSATTHRIDEGLVAREEYVFSVLRGVSKYCGENRINSIAIPLIGSGHGQLTPRVSLISILQAINSVSATSFITDVKIVVFKKGSQDAQIPEWEISRLIELATWLQQRPALT